MITLGLDVHESILSVGPEERRALLSRAFEVGLDHVCVGDHVSFHGGAGFDGMVSATAALASHDRLPVWVAVYQLALRHPLVVARQLASLAQVAPGRLVLGVGAGGEDRLEVSNCGVDPATRGRRLDECLDVLGRLASGEPVDHEGRFFSLAQAAIRPAPAPAAPVLIGGGSPAAIRRTARHGDGWLGIFCSARRFAATVEEVRHAAAEVGRSIEWFGLQVWCGLDDRPSVARDLLAPRMEQLYQLPYERFEHVAPAGSPAEVAEWLVPYVAAGSRHFTLIASTQTWEAGVDHAAAVKASLLEAVR